MDGVLIRLCGTLTVIRDGVETAVPGRKARVLLARLASAGGAVEAGELVDDLWHGRPPSRPHDNVATLVSRLRAALGPDVVAGGRRGYRLGPAPAVRVDLTEARRLAAEAGRRLRAGEPALVLAAAGRGLDLLADGRALVGEPDDRWVAAVRAEATALVRTLRHLVAEAAPAAGEHTAAVDAAQAAVVADPLDERAHRLLMAAHHAAGEQDRALEVHARLRSALAESLGVDPDEQTRALHLAILRHTPAPSAPARPETLRRPAPPGRDGELTTLTAAWSSAAGGRAGAVLITGEAGIGKTTLAEAAAQVAEQTGGRVLRARCYGAERSLFLQPVIDAVDPLLQTLPADRVRRLAGAGAAALAALLPDAALGAPTTENVDPEVGRRRAYEAVRSLLVSLAADQPTLLLLDDLHNAGSATVELLHYVLRRTAGARLLVLATVRGEEGAALLAALAEVTARLDVGALPPDAVSLLAARAGVPRHAEDVLRRTRGHTLFVVESLRALSGGETGVPESLQAAVHARLGQAGSHVERVLRAGAVLGAAVDPGLVAALLELPEPEVVRLCEQAAEARLLVPAGADYEFANDLLQEVLYLSTSEPTRLAHHRRVVDLLTDRPEALAVHAEVLGDRRRAARAWLAAGEQAARRFASADACALLDRAVTAVEDAGDGFDEPGLVGRIRFARALVHEALARYSDAAADLRAAGAAFRTAGERRMEVSVARRFAGQLATVLPVGELEHRLDDGARVAGELADPGAQAELDGGRAVIAANRLDFASALRFGHRAAAAGRAAGTDEALAAGLDGLKTAHAYLGETPELGPVLAELVPLLRQLRWPEYLSWAVFESALPAVAAAEWDAAVAAIDEALGIKERGAMSTAEAWLVAHRGWVERWRGRHADAVDRGRHAVRLARAAPHDWWLPAADALLATTLLELGETDEAIELLREGYEAATRAGEEAYVLRCAAPLAEATGSADVLSEADALLAGIRAPAGSAWLAGGDAYLSVARTWRRRGEPGRARAVLSALTGPAERLGWIPWQAAGALEEAGVLSDLGEHDAAAGRLRRARELAERHGMPSLAARAAAGPDRLVVPADRATTGAAADPGG